MLKTIFEKDDSRVENLVIDEFESGPRITGKYRIAATTSEDYGKDHQPEPINQPQLHQMLHQTNAAKRSQRLARLPLECLDLVCDKGRHEARVLPDQRLLKGAGEYQLRQLVHAKTNFVD